MLTRLPGKGKSGQGFSKVVKVTSVAAISNRAFSGGIRARLGNRGYIRDFGKTLQIWISVLASQASKSGWARVMMT